MRTNFGLGLIKAVKARALGKLLLFVKIRQASTALSAHLCEARADLTVKDLKARAKHHHLNAFGLEVVPSFSEYLFICGNRTLKDP